ncbi:MAG: TIGR04282 family arsenosugar biosynthesis glycosyltransferase [Armatimonadota bacterium]|jgi:rSAM/selenodomain-associated transferase 1
MIRRLVLFATPPLPGRSKTRLAQQLGAAPAARVAEALLHDTIALCESLAQRFPEQETRLVLAYTERQDWFTPALSADWRLIEQRGEDLGERIENVLADLAPADDDRTVFIGMDCPQMPPERVAEAFEALEDANAVLGPCEDGGYYLLGVSGGIPEGLLRRVRWGTSEALGDAVAALEGAGLSLAQLVPGYDVDTAEDLQRLAREMAADALDGLANMTKTLADLGM